MKDDIPKWWYIIEPNARMAETCAETLPSENQQKELKIRSGKSKVDVKTGWQVDLDKLRQILQFGRDESLGFDCRVARTDSEGKIRYARRQEYLTPEQRRHNDDRQLARELQRRTERATRLVRGKFGTVTLASKMAKKFSKTKSANR